MYADTYVTILAVCFFPYLLIEAMTQELEKISLIKLKITVTIIEGKDKEKKNTKVKNSFLVLKVFNQISIKERSKQKYFLFNKKNNNKILNSHGYALFIFY